jgi:protoporphyrinogen oxidase
MMPRSSASGRPIIAGAGLAGLAAARALHGRAPIVFEAEESPGGLCRSIRRDGYLFDYTGHLLHLKGPMLDEIERLLSGNLAIHHRRAFIRIAGREIPFPFQANLRNLPAAMRDECLDGFVAASSGEIDRANFAAWCRTVFGAGITRHFLRPYNEKLYRTPLEGMSADWVHYIPRPTVEEVRRGATEDAVEGIGYNAVFRYPREGGIGVLPAALANGVPTRTATAIEAIDLAARTVTAGGERLPCDRLISTIPLPALLALIEDAPEAMKTAASGLEAVGCLCLNLGIDGPTRDAHWIYYPEPEHCFYRVGFYHNFAPSSAPAGKSSLYVEISARRREDLGEGIVERAIRDLVAAEVIRSAGAVETVDERWIAPAYAIHTEARRASLAAILPWLETHGITPIGRFGRWTYTSMGEAIEEGRRAAGDSDTAEG